MRLEAVAAVVRYQSLVRMPAACVVRDGPHIEKLSCVPPQTV